jgi:hypothetical protein
MWTTAVSLASEERHFGFRPHASPKSTTAQTDTRIILTRSVPVLFKEHEPLRRLFKEHERVAAVFNCRVL